MKKLCSSIPTVIVAIIAAFIVSTACSNNTTETPAVEFSRYIKAYTGNLITAGNNVTIEFSATPEKKGDKDLIIFKPAMKGEYVWTTENTLCFIPDEGEMKAGQSYSAELQMNKLFTIEDLNLQRFKFGFRTAPRQAIMKIHGINIPYDSPESISISGTLTLSEPVSHEVAAQMISVDSKEAKIEIQQIDRSDIHNFSITGIKAKDYTSALTISLDGTKVGFSSKQTEDVEIPSPGSYYVASADLIDGDEEYIEVRLSAPVGQMDDYSGLVTVAGVGRQIVDIKDNIIKIYFERTSDKEPTLYISQHLRSISNRRLEDDYIEVFTNNTPKPAVEIPLNGTIIPDISSFILPFKAVSLCAVDIKVVKIYENNILMFLQDNNLNQSSELRRSGRLVYKKTIRLDEDSALDLHKWQNFSVDLSGLIKHEPGAIYRVTLTFNQDYSIYGEHRLSHGSENAMVNIESGDLTEEEIEIWDTPYSYYYESYYDWDLYEWSERNDPTKPSYYMDSSKYPSCNLLSSNLGIIVKSAEGGKIWVNINDINTTEPIKNAEIKVYNYQLQEIGQGNSNLDGSCQIKVTGKPFVVVVAKDGYKSYLKVQNGEENSLSRFDTGGRKLEKGLKGFIYGERGIWRPGDELFLTMILDDQEHTIPDNHPVTMELFTPQGQFYSKQVSCSSQGGFYSFAIQTKESDPTGKWNAYLKVGGATFHKAIPIETIKPNRLKIELDVLSDILIGNRYTRMNVKSSWLTGPAASGLNARAEMTLKPQNGTFAGYDGYVFFNPEKDFISEPTEIFNTTLDTQGKAQISAKIPAAQNAPGMLTAQIITKVTEPGGDESTISQTIPFSPFSSYVGVRLPETDGHYETDKDHIFNVATVDMDGHRVSGHRIEYTIYKLDWSWWWDYSSSNSGAYINSSNAEIYSQGRFISSQQDESIIFNLAYPDWGRFYILVKDLDSGHSCGKVFMVDWPSWRGRADRNNPEATSMLTFSTDKKAYTSGEECIVYIPAAANGNALVSLENGRGVISQEWVKTSGDCDTQYKFTITKDMAPNFYVHITLIQPHVSTKNGTPIRLYGVVPVLVSDTSTALTPVLTVPDVIRPQEEFTVKVSEKNGRKMTYTLAIVDEGLLDITSFKTPDPWSYMYAREALGVNTWDIYNDVTGAFSGSFASMFKVGGDQYIETDGKKRDNRFNPVVQFLGPFTTSGTQTHKIKLPMYVGSVRIMAVAGNEGAYGNAEKTVPVRSPLMLLATAPRELSVEETVTIPVNVFAMEDNVRNVKVTISAEGSASVCSAKSSDLRFDTTGDRLVRFEIKTNKAGKAKITIKAECGEYKTSETINLDVHNDYGQRIQRQRTVINGGETITLDWNSNSKWAKLEAAGFPCIDYNGLYSFTTGYKHYCTEQICSRGLSLLSSMKMLDEDKDEEIRSMIDDLLQQLYSRQDSEGGFRYWPDASCSNLWCSAMAGHFMTMAEEKGFQVNSGVYNKWKSFEKKAVKSYRNTGYEQQHDLAQAYGLYTLALCGSPDNGAMNRMKESGALSVQSALMLSSAYSLCGKASIAKNMIENLTADFSNYPSSNMTFGSVVRDKAIAIEAFTRAGETPRALELADEVAREISLSGYTTQTAAFAAIALDILSKSVSTSAIQLEIKQRETKQVSSAKAVGSWDLKAQHGNVSITNKTNESIVLNLVSCYQPSFGEQTQASSSNLIMKIGYYDMSGNPIDPKSLKQGTEFTSVVQITNNSLNSYSNLALTVAIPSGWEIFNERIYALENDPSTSLFTHNDIRDKASIYYFDLPRGQSKTFKTRIIATYEGTFSQPSISCEAMYDNSVYAYSDSGIVRVIR